MGQLFTIGYSGLAIAQFLGLLTEHGVDVVCDVRSVPYSRFRPDYSRRELKRHLNQSGIKYAFFGDELGARPKERSVYVDGQAVHNLIAKQDFFNSGLDRLRKGVAEHNLTLLCSEREPLECHRAILVCRHLSEIRNNITHIHPDGHTETQDELEHRLVSLLGLNPLPLLGETASPNAVLQEAYDRQSSRIAFTEAKMDTSKQLIAS
jgi:uncharacterized protein (DUF488 family)